MIAKQSFDARSWMGVAIFNHAAQFLYSYRYKSGAIENALQKAFSRSQNVKLFGSCSNDGPEYLKVGVIAMDGVDTTKPWLLANYSRDWRQQLGKGKFDFDFLVSMVLNCGIVLDDAEGFGDEDYLCREDDPRKELLTWEA